MYIVNRHYYVVTNPAVTITNDANPDTGLQSPIWKGTKPVMASGASGDLQAGEGGINITGVPTSIDQYITTCVAIELRGALVANFNTIRVSLSKIGVHGIRGAFGASIIGLYKPNSTEGLVTPTPSAIIPFDTALAVEAILNDALIITIANNADARALFQGSVVHVEIKHNK